MFLMLAAGKKSIPIDANLDEESEVDEGLADLEAAEAIGRQGRKSPYWPKIRERLLQFSSTDDVDEAVREWVDSGNPFTASSGTCELCDKHPIKFHFPIKNRVTGKGLVVGSECVLNYLMIAGYESVASLRKRLVAQRNILKKKEKGEVTDEQVAAVNEAFEIEKDLRSRIGAVSGGGADFDLKEYREALWDAISIGNSLRIQSTAFQSASDAYKATRQLQKFMDDVRKRQKGFTSDKLAELVTTVMRQRDPQGRTQQLNTLRRIMGNVFQFGQPSDVISRAWGAIKESKDTLADQIVKKADEGKSRLMETYKDELDLARPYQHLQFMLSQGLAAQRKAFDEQVEKVQAALQDDNFLEQIKSESSAVAKLLNVAFYPDLGNSDGSLEQAAYNVGQFLDLVGKNFVSGVTSAIEGIFAIDSNIRDAAGVRVAILRAADDGIIDADVLGPKAIADFEKKLRAKEPKILDLIQTEVNDISDLARRTGNLRICEVMGEDLGFDVEQAFKLYSADNNFEKDFCQSLFNRVWKQGRQLSPAQMGNIKRQISMKSRQGEVKNSMWDAMKAELTAKYRPTR